MGHSVFQKVSSLEVSLGEKKMISADGIYRCVICHKTNPSDDSLNMNTNGVR